jgi:hypothetical protein
MVFLTSLVLQATLPIRPMVPSSEPNMHALIWRPAYGQNKCRSSSAPTILLKTDASYDDVGQTKEQEKVAQQWRKEKASKKW